MNRLFLVCLRPVQSPEVIIQQSPAWRPKQWQCYCYTQLFMEASALKMEGWFGFYINWWKYISNWLDIVSECSSSCITFDTKYQTFISIHDRIPENVEDANDSWVVFNCQFIENIFLYWLWNLLNKFYFFCFTNHDFTFSRLVLKDGVIGLSGAGSLFFKISHLPQSTAPETMERLYRVIQ